MPTITIYRFPSGFQNVCDKFALEITAFEEADAIPEPFDLPNGYTIEENMSGEKQIYDSKGNPCWITGRVRKGRQLPPVIA